MRFFKMKRMVYVILPFFIFLSFSSCDKDMEIQRKENETDKNDGMDRANQAALAEIAKNDTDSWVRYAAVEKLTDKKLLTEIAKNTDNDGFVRSAAFRNPHFSDQTLLEYVAKTDDDAGLRAVAVQNITDQNLLAKIAKYYESPDMRVAAVKNHNLTDKKLLAEIAEKDKNWEVRQAALERVLTREKN